MNRYYKNTRLSHKGLLLITLRLQTEKSIYKSYKNILNNDSLFSYCLI